MLFAPHRLRLEADRVDDIEGRVRQSLSDVLGGTRPPDRIAVACGSRNITDLVPIVSSLVRGLHERGYRPFLVPAMGSHGGATSAGQRELLEELGLTEERLDVPIRSSMEVEKVGETAQGLPVYWDREALAADGVIVVNRVKPHSTLHPPLGSGLKKMIAIGLGKQKGAETLHRARLQDHLRPVAALLLERAPILGGIAIVENGCGQTAWIEGVPRQTLLDRDDQLLETARAYLPHLPLLPLDVLVIRQVGKNISGTGMDPNVIGRHRRHGGQADVDIATIVALHLTPESHGNATGIGMADLITERLQRAIDWKATSTNCLTGQFVQGMRLPYAFPSDRDAIAAALNLCPDPGRARCMVIEDTAHLETIYVSESLAGEAKENPSLEPMAPFTQLAFGLDGGLAWPPSLDPRKEA